MLRKFLACLLFLGLGPNFDLFPAKKAKKAAYKKTCLISNQTKKSLRRFFKKNKELCFLLAVEVSLLSIFAGLIYFSEKKSSSKQGSKEPVQRQDTATQKRPISQNTISSQSWPIFHRPTSFTRIDSRINPPLYQPFAKPLGDATINRSWYTAPFATTQTYNFYCGIYAGAAALASQKQIYLEPGGVTQAPENLNFIQICDQNYEALKLAFDSFLENAQVPMAEKLKLDILTMQGSQTVAVSAYSRIYWAYGDDVIRFLDDNQNTEGLIFIKSLAAQNWFLTIAPKGVQTKVSEVLTKEKIGEVYFASQDDLDNFFEEKGISLRTTAESLLLLISTLLVEEKENVNNIFLKTIKMNSQGLDEVDTTYDETNNVLLLDKLNNYEKVMIEKLYETGRATFLIRRQTSEHFVCLDIDKDRPVVKGIDLRVIYRDSMHPETPLPDCAESQTLRAHLITFLDAKFPLSGS